MPQLLWARGVAKKVLPERSVDWYRRKRATRQYLEALSYELLERETRLDHLEGRVAARRDGFYQRIVTDVLERTEIILQELDRRIEGLSARTGQRLSGLEDRLGELAEEMRALRDAIGEDRAGPVPDRDAAGRGAEQAPSAVGE
ncbi:MAG: hypothetical protein HY658_12935 [Actinobacteria bacterium]|nr:hypothetical protein [Actinomycetota bacterium]